MYVFVLFAQLIQKIIRCTEFYIASAALLCVVFGGILFAYFAHHSLWESLYWAIVTAATVGYGDISPNNVNGQIIAIGLMFTAIPLFGALFSIFVAHIAEAKIRRIVGMEYIGSRKDHNGRHAPNPSS